MLICSMDPSPFTRNSFWGYGIGVTLVYISHLGISQNAVQRFLSIPNVRDVKK